VVSAAQGTIAISAEALVSSPTVSRMIRTSKPLRRRVALMRLMLAPPPPGFAYVQPILRRQTACIMPVGVERYASADCRCVARRGSLRGVLEQRGDLRTFPFNPLVRGNMSDFWRQHGFDWMAGLSERETERLLGRSTSRECARGETVFEPTQNPELVYLLERGLIRIFRLSAQGSEVTLGYVRDGEVFGELEVISDRARESFAQANCPSLVWRIPIPELRRLIETAPRIALRIAEQMEKRFRRVESRVEGLALRDLRSRVCYMLLELAEDFGRQEGGEIVIDLPLSQLDLATLVGASRQSVNECLRELREARRITTRQRRFALLDPVGLRLDAGREKPQSG
jgi:CRP/FNR family cyclic AMP-dependent transcriptional regulator